MDWHQLPSHSRTWIYQSDRFFSEEETTTIKKMADEFVEGWSSHGVQLSAAIEIFHGLFIVIFADEEQAAASGCSIDKSMNLIKNIENKFQLKLTDRMRFAFMEEGKVSEGSLNELVGYVKEGRIKNDTQMFDNLMTDKKEFELSWLKTFSESWHKKFAE